MDPLFLGGLVITLVGIAASTVMDGNSFGPLIGPSSLIMVFVGGLGASLMGYRKTDVSLLPKSFVYALKGSPPDPDGSITELAALADVARKEGMLALEAKLPDIEDDFLKRGLQLVVDGLESEQVREVLNIDIACVDERHQTAIAFWKTMGGYAPTFGMVGTVIGLINMLGNLSDPAALGKGMSMALLTTLYGVLFANLVYMPVANKLARLNDIELAAREVVLDGILAVQAGTSPRVLVERLETFLPPDQRVGHAARTGAPAVAAEAA